MSYQNFLVGSCPTPKTPITSKSQPQHHRTFFIPSSKLSLPPKTISESYPSILQRIPSHSPKIPSTQVPLSEAHGSCTEPRYQMHGRRSSVILFRCCNSRRPNKATTKAQIPNFQTAQKGQVSNSNDPLWSPLLNANNLLLETFPPFHLWLVHSSSV